VRGHYPLQPQRGALVHLRRGPLAGTVTTKFLGRRQNYSQPAKTAAHSKKAMSVVISVKLAPIAQDRRMIVGQGQTQFRVSRGGIVAMQEKAVIEM
jgi:hypothetical protein